MQRLSILFLLASTFLCVATGCGDSSTPEPKVKAETNVLTIEAEGPTIVSEPTQIQVSGQSVNASQEADGQAGSDSESHGLILGGVRPRIIIQEEEEELLGLDVL